MHVTYDAIGNITAKTVGSNTFYLYYDAAHKHAVDYVRYNSTNYNYNYDANGNMTEGYDFTNPAAVRLRTVTVITGREVCQKHRFKSMPPV
jgi:hypothetical protein